MQMSAKNIYRILFLYCFILLSILSFFILFYISCFRTITFFHVNILISHTVQSRSLACPLQPLPCPVAERLQPGLESGDLWIAIILTEPHLKKFSMLPAPRWPALVQRTALAVLILLIQTQR